MINSMQETIKLTPTEFDELAKIYQSAFAGPPWYEVSKCPNPDVSSGCASGFSPLAVGEMCAKCALAPTEVAYPQAELQASLEERFNYPGSRLYREYDENGHLLLAAVMWEDPPATIGIKKYSDVPQMQDWLASNLPNEPLIWLDEIFADRTRRPGKNLWNFKNMVDGALESSNCSIFAFRTINEALIAKSSRAFGDRCLVLKQGELPDRRSLVLIRRAENE